MLLNKGLITDTNELKQPANSWRKAVNLFWNKSNLLENENGFDSFLLDNAPYIIGIIETPDKAVLFVYTSTSSNIFTVNESGVLTLKLSIPSSTNNDSYIRFSLTHPIEGTYFYNYKGDLIICWTDEFNKPCLLNLDDLPFATAANIFIGTKETLARIHLQFEYIDDYACSVSTQEGGNLQRGTYFIFYRFGLNSQELGNYILYDKPFIFVNDKDIVAKTLLIELVSDNYTTANVVLCHKDYNNGIYYYDLGVKTLGTSYNTAFSIDSLTGKTKVDPSQVLVPNILSRKIGTLTSLENRLVAARITTDEEFNYQPYAININVHWNFEVPSDPYTVYAHRTWRHGEVYALYIAWRMKDGTLSRAYHIPAKSISNPLAISTLGYYRYQIEDTCTYSSGIGTPGTWYNLDETYPNTSDWQGANGGENLRGTLIRHHKMPSLGFMQESLFAADPHYGISYLDTITLSFSNVVIPTALAGKVIEPVFFAATKEIGNCYIKGQGLLQWSGQHQNNDGLAWATGGNWKLANYAAGNNNEINIFKDYCRINSFELLFDKPTLEPNILRNEYKLTKTGITLIGNNSESRRYGQLDYPAGDLTTNPGTVSTTPLTDKIRAVDKAYYLPTNVSFSHFKNDYCEETIVIEGNTKTLTMSTGTWENTMPTEITYFTSLCKITANLHLDFMNQTLWMIDKDGSGDCFQGYYTYVTLAPADGDDFPVPETALSAGTRVVRRYVTESRFNLDALKYYNVSNHNSIPPYNLCTLNYLNNIDPFLPFDRLYSYAYNAISNVVLTIPFNPNVVFVNTFPNRIIRSIVQASESKGLTWRTFLPNEYYELKKDKGAITKIIGLDKILLIQTTYSTFPAIIKDVLSTSNVEAYLGQSDIFDREPQELLYTPLGYAGNQHQFSTCNCKQGFIWCDANAGKVFLFKTQLEELSNKGTSDLIKGYLSLLSSTNPFDPTYGRLNSLTIGYNEVINTVIFKMANNCISYSFDIPDGRWISEHTYRPNYLFTINRSLFSYVRETSASYLYRFNKLTVKTTFDNHTTDYSLLEVIFNILENLSKLWQNVNWKTKLTAITNSPLLLNTVIYNKTFSDITIYNDGQCSPKISLTPQYDIVKANISTLDYPVIPSEVDGVTLREDGKEVMINKVSPCKIIDPSVLSLSEQLHRTTDGLWNFNGFMDMVLDIYKHFDKYNTASDTNIANWITKTDKKLWTKPSPLREKSPYHIQDFISEYLGVIMTYDNVDQLKLEIFEVGSNAIVTSPAQLQEKLNITK